MKRLLVGCTGSVAAIKLLELLEKLEKTNLFEIRVVVTKAAQHFLKEDMEKLKNSYTIHTDEEQWLWQKRGDKILHIELRQWADALLIAPLSAHTLAKMANGLCDNTLTLVYRCWKDNPVVVCPAMNTFMWENQLTDEHLTKIKKMGVHVIDPIEKILMCGETGKGAMENTDNIVSRLCQILGTVQKQQLRQSQTK